MNLVLDLDGVVYRGETLIDGADQALADAMAAGAHIWFVTNNSTKTPVDVVKKLGRLTGLSFDPSVVITSALAAAAMLDPTDGPVLVLGSVAIEEAVADRGLAVTREPHDARSVVVGLDRELTYQRLASAVTAVRSGSRFIATNVDPTYPVEAGFEPGSGAIVAAVAVAAEVDPEVAGKPNEATRDLLELAGVTDAWVIGDRLDTDIALADRAKGWKSALVLTGVTGEGDDHSAADFVAEDLLSAISLVLGETE